jgi:anti-sigma-K factor RskA
VTRLEDLLADKALVGLDQEEARELERLLDNDMFADPLEFELAAAALDLAMGPSEFEPLPDDLRERLLADSDGFADAARESAAHAQAPAPRLAPVPMSGPLAPRSPGAAWWVAAAAAVIAVLGWFAALSETPVTDPGAQRAELLALGDVTRVEWSATELAPDAVGDVVWSQERQAGFLRFEGLPVNDPTAEQYQLWIFDAEQEHPIDGGVFDITADGEVLIPIDAKLAVASPTLFAVTVEKPGGVVVSDRERIAVLGQI